MYNFFKNKICLFAMVLILSFFSTSILAQAKTFDVAFAFRSGTDKYDTFADSMAVGIEFAKVLFEKEHPNTKITLKDFGYPKQLAAVNEMANKIVDAKVDAVIGGEVSEDALVLGEVLNANHILFLTPTATNPRVTLDKPYVFRMFLSDEELGKKLAFFTNNSIKPTSVAIIHNVSLPYTDYLSGKFYDELSKISSVPIVVKKTLKRQVDFNSLIDDLIQRKVDTVVLFDYDSAVRRFVLLASAKGFFPTYIGSDGWGSNESIFKILGLSSEYLSRFKAYRNYYWKENAQTPISKKFRAAFVEKYNKTPNVWNAVGFDTGWVLFTALAQSTKSKDGASLIANLHSIKNLELTTTEHFSFSGNNTPNRELYMYKLSGSGADYVTTLRAGDGL